MTALKDKVGRKTWAMQDRILDLDLPDRISDPMFNLVEWVQSAACRVLGHQPTEDHCGRPEHDYCLWCHERTPGKAVRSANS